MLEEDMEIVKVFQCRFCRKFFEVTVLQKDYDALMRGEGQIQDIFPYLTAGERELFLSSICNTCFDELLAEPEEDDEEY